MIILLALWMETYEYNLTQTLSLVNYWTTVDHLQKKPYVTLKLFTLLDNNVCTNIW